MPDARSKLGLVPSHSGQQADCSEGTEAADDSRLSTHATLTLKERQRTEKIHQQKKRKAKREMRSCAMNMQ